MESIEHVSRLAEALNLDFILYFKVLSLVFYELLLSKHSADARRF